MHASYKNDVIFSSKIYYYITSCTKLSNYLLIMAVEYIKYTIRIVKLIIDYKFSIPIIILMYFIYFVLHIIILMYLIYFVNHIHVYIKLYLLVRKFHNFFNCDIFHYHSI